MKQTTNKSVMTQKYGENMAKKKSMSNLALRFFTLKKLKEPGQSDKFPAKINKPFANEKYIIFVQIADRNFSTV